jgi:hypothetical protein
VRTPCAQCAALHDLGLAAGATLDEVKAAYKMLVKVWHPDRFQGDERLAQAAEAKLKAINTAYSYLTSNGYTGGARPDAGSDEGAVPGTAAHQASSAEGTAAKWTQRPADRRVSSVRRDRGARTGQKRVIRALALLAVVIIGALLLNLSDSYVAANPRVGRYYVGFKSQLIGNLDDAWQRTRGELERGLHAVFGGSAGSAPVATQAASEPAAEAPAPETVTATGGERHDAAKEPAGQLKLLPYVTVGLTRDEVVSAQGTPTSSSDDKLMYGASELDLKDGKVVGWKIDPRSSLRVKLWPEGPVDNSLRFFTVGSTKDDVLAVQGTPTSFSQDRFEYGGAVVYFRDNRVLAWKNGIGSVRLRAQQ